MGLNMTPDGIFGSFMQTALFPLCPLTDAETRDSVSCQLNYVEKKNCIDIFIFFLIFLIAKHKVQVQRPKWMW